MIDWDHKKYPMPKTWMFVAGLLFGYYILAPLVIELLGGQ